MSFRKLPIIMAALFILITFTRVASFSASTMKAGWLGYIFSLALSVSVFVSAYWTKNGDRNSDSKVQNKLFWSSWSSLVFFAVIDCLFNLIDVLLPIRDSKDVVVIGAGVVYGLFPTLAAALLGTLQGAVDRLPPLPPHKYDIVRLVKLFIFSKVNTLLDQPSLPVQSKVNLIEVNRKSSLPSKVIKTSTVKSNAILSLLKSNPEYTDTQIANSCEVSKAYVGQLRKRVDNGKSISPNGNGS